MPETVITFRDVSKSFGDNVILDKANLEVKRGETLAVLGASGSGKSVTLKTTNGLIPIDSGSVEVLGERISSMDEKRLVPLRRRISYLFQGGALFDSMNVFDNLAFPLREHLNLSSEETQSKISELLAMVQLGKIETKFPTELSGGMKKRVALARALALEPEIILYDEPTTGLDPVTSRAIARLILDLDQRLGVTSLVVTHDIALVAEIADRVVFLERGKFIFSGTVAEARSKAPEQVQLFFKGISHA